MKMNIADINIMERAFKEYTRWKAMKLPADLTAELKDIEGDTDEIYDRFCKDIAFGTSGLRGKMGAGSNRINSVVLRKASMGIARYLKERQSSPGLVIGFDTRINSREYAASVARVFAENGVNAYVFSEATPVPVVSFAVRFLGLSGGIMITASHNPKEYNGYKVYDSSGNQIDSRKAAVIEKFIVEADPFGGGKGTGAIAGEEDGSGCVDRPASDGQAQGGQVITLDSSVKEAYLKAVSTNALWWEQPEQCRKALSDLKVCYTPLNGSGLGYVTRVLKTLGVGTLDVVESQREPDGNFPTCPSPNPENDGAFLEALKLCKERHNEYDVIIATDPDSDRMGAAVLSEGEYYHLSGNQVGELMFDYILRCHDRGACGKTLRKGMTAFKSYVSSPLVEEMGQSYGVKVKNVFTGFKNIAVEMERLKESGRSGDFLFGFEESLGYLYGDYTRDKDGIMAAQLLCLMAAELKANDTDLSVRLEELYRRYGYIESITTAMVYRHERDREKMAAIVEALFDGKLKRAAGCRGILKKEMCYRQQNMYCADLEGGHRVIIRPSGTELKLKIYIFARGKTRDEAIDTAARLCSLVRNTLEEENE